jgi:lipopolysaccharide assembly outer membrane protein LptD (OstA)
VSRYILFLFILLISAPVFSDEVPTANPTANVTANISRAMTIEADVVNYIEDNQFVDATGNVIFVFKNYTGTANHSTLDTLQDQLTMDHGFVLQRYSRTFKGESLDYNLRTETGLGQNVEFNLSGNNIHGKEVFIGRDKILVNDATMTICSDVPPHYFISASKITIYPKWNMTVADNAVLHVLGVPVAYIPSYVANNQARDVSQLLIPEFGENRVEGKFVKLKLGYHASEKVQGTIDMDYLEKLEYRLGFTNTSLLDTKSSVQTRVHQVGRHGMELGFRYQTLLGVPSEKNDLSVTDFFAGIVPPTREEYPELLVDLTYQEIVSYEFVSYLPQITLISPKYMLWNSDFYLNG